MPEQISTSRYSGRRRNNAIAMVLPLGGHAVRPRLAGADPRRAAVEGLQRPVARGLHRDDAAARLRRRPAQCDHRQPGPDGPRGADRHADRHPGRHLYGRVWPPRPADHGGALHQRHPAQRAVDRDRPVHLRGHGRADGAFLRLGRRRRARRDRHSGRGAHHRGHADPGAELAARGRGLDRPAALADDHPHLLSRRPGRHDDRRAAGGRAHQRRDRAAAVHRAQQPVLEHQPQRADGEPAGRHLPVRAQPLQGLAAAGLDRRADHHLAVLALSITARALSASGKQS